MILQIVFNNDRGICIGREGNIMPRNCKKVCMYLWDPSEASRIISMNSKIKSFMYSETM